MTAPARTLQNHPRRVLVVDDDADCAAVLSLLLRHDGHVVQTARDGASALDAAGDFEPHLVVLDLRLSDMSGYELASALRASEATRASTLLALTGLDGAEVRSRCLAAGIDGHLVKPIRDFDAFKRQVRSLELDEALRLA